jgi:hypothetical protein
MIKAQGRFVLSLAIAAGSWSHLNGQATGTIHGTVVDQTHAVIADAAVTATHLGTNQQRNVRTDSAGQYVIPLLPVGRYNVRVEKEGFAPFLQEGVVLQASTNIQVAAQMSIRTTAEQVTVHADATLVQATSTALVQIVDERRISDLPLDGRNVLELIGIMAGVSDRNASGSTIQANSYAGGRFHYSASINGSRGDGTNFLLDNADNNEGYTNIAAPFPNPDAVQEFSFQTSSYDAQYGRNSGAIVNVVTRAGSNQFHGTVFHFLRNNKLNAANFFSGRDTLKRNQFGVSFGGRIVKDRTFFFASYQGSRQRTSTPAAVTTAPSEAMKNGDLSAWLQANGAGRIRDPNNPGQYFPNNQIPRNQFDPVAARLLPHLPTSTSPDYQLRYSTPNIADDDEQIVARGDHMLSNEQRLSLRYFLTHVDRPWGYLPPPAQLFGVRVGEIGFHQNAAVNHSYTMTPRLLNDVTLAFIRTKPVTKPPEDLQVSLASFGSRILPTSNYPSLAVSVSGWAGLGNSRAVVTAQNTFHLSDTLAYATGRHNLRLGGDVKRYRMDLDSYSGSGGSASFSGQLLSDSGRQNAGNAFAEFLLGRVASWSQRSFSSWRLETMYPAFFIQDDIRLTRKLTVNLGLRWDPKFDFDERDGQKQTTFVAGRQSQRFPGAHPGILFRGDPGFEDYIVPPDWNNLAPRIGFAYEILPRTVIRSAYGIFYEQMMSIMYNRAVQAEPFVYSRQLNDVRLVNPYGSEPPLDPNPVVPGPEFVFGRYTTLSVPGPHLVTPYVQHWNFVVERQVLDHWLIRAAYVGSKGTKLLHSHEENPALFAPGASASNYNQRRRHQPIGPMQVGRSVGWSKYNALQLTLQRRFARGFTVLANYTRSKSMDIGSYTSLNAQILGPDPFNYEANRGVSDFDIPQRLVVSALVEHPALQHKHRLVRSFFGGWQSNVIFTAQDGVPFTVRSGRDNSLYGINQDFPDLTGIDWRQPDGRSKEQEILAWFNPDAFRENAVGTIGTGRRNQLRGPGLWDVNYSLFKNLPLSENFRLQVRGEFFNLFNHANLGNPNSTRTNANFGRITSALPPRIVQLGAKLIF